MTKNEYIKQWRKNNPDKVKLYNKNKYQRDKLNSEKMKIKRINEKKWRASNKEYSLIYQKKWSQKKFEQIKEKIYDKLGHVCVKCGFSDKRALCIDHLNGGGYSELRSMSVFKYYNKVLNDTTNSYQILCHNCNWIKKRENNEVRKSKKLEIYNVKK